MSSYLNKWLLIPALMLLPRLALQAQDFSDLKEVDFKSPASCKHYEQKALECAEYILSTAQLPPDNRRVQALQFMIRWMGATPDYQFNLNDRVGRWLNNEEPLLGEYMAALTEYCLRQKDGEIDPDAMKAAALHRLAVYCNDPAHGIRPDRNIRKLISADRAGKLDPYLRN